jgi:hypothetical protein
MPGAKGSRAILTIKDASLMSQDSRRELAAWLNLRAANLITNGAGYETIQTFEYLVRRTDRKCQS